jgi:hypothetical protein
LEQTVAVVVAAVVIVIRVMNPASQPDCFDCCCYHLELVVEEPTIAAS